MFHSTSSQLAMPLLCDMGGPGDHSFQAGSKTLQVGCEAGDYSVVKICQNMSKSARTEGAGAWSSGWHSSKVTGLPGGGGIFRPKPPVFDRSWRSPSKNTVKNSTEDTCSWTRPSKIGKRKVKKTRVFQLFDLNFLVCNIFFCGSAGGLARRRIFEFLDPFSDWFSSFCDSRNTGFYSVFLFSACLTASFKTSKNLVNYTVLCYGVNENIVNTSVFWRWLKKHCKLQCFWPPDPQKP